MDNRLEKFIRVFGTTKPIIGMVHLKPLPGAPRYDSRGGMQSIGDMALKDAKALVSGGVDALQVENQWERSSCFPMRLSPMLIPASVYISLTPSFFIASTTSSANS